MKKNALQQIQPASGFSMNLTNSYMGGAMCNDKKYKQPDCKIT